MKNVTAHHARTIMWLTACTLLVIGMGAIVMDGAEIGEESIVGAGALVTEGAKIPPRTLTLGSPAKVVRDLRPEEIEELKISADNYVAYAGSYRAQTNE